MGYEIFAEDATGERTVFLRARTVLTPYVFATERPRRLHAGEKESLTRLLEPDEPVAHRRRSRSWRCPAAPIRCTCASATSTSTATSTT